MVTVKKFQGHLANKDACDKIISLPYDVLNREEARAAAEGNDMCYYHVNKPEIDLPDDCEEQEIFEQG